MLKILGISIAKYLLTGMDLSTAYRPASAARGFLRVGCMPLLGVKFCVAALNVRAGFTADWSSKQIKGKSKANDGEDKIHRDGKPKKTRLTSAFKRWPVPKPRAEKTGAAIVNVPQTATDKK